MPERRGRVNRIDATGRAGFAPGETTAWRDRRMIVITQATTQEDLDEVRELMRAFVAWHRAAHPDDADLIGRYFDAAGFERELDGLPGPYAPPRGRLLLAREGGRAVGCVALRDLGDGACEMKRMFVPAEFRGLGVGRRLADALLEEARGAGYRRMRLDTSHRQTDAIRLYERSGFRRIPPPDDLSAELKAWLVFFERPLEGSGAGE